MNFFETIVVSLKDIFSYKLRSFLTMLGIGMGVASLVAVFALGRGLESNWMGWIRRSGGLEKVSIYDKIPDKKMGKTALISLSKGKTYEDGEAILENCPLVKEVSPEIALSNVPIRYKDKSSKIRNLYGVTWGILTVNNNAILAEGRFITQSDLDNFNRICILGTKPKSDLFGESLNPIGRIIEIKGIPHKVVGVMKHWEMMRKWGGKERNVLERLNEIIYIPFTSAQKRFTGEKKITYLNFEVKDIMKLSEAVSSVKEILLRRHNYIEDFGFNTREDRVEAMKKSLRNSNIGFGSIAFLCLLVGGIGIMNILLATLSERIREIGVRKAIGAKDRNILLQFLMEAIFLSAFGGLSGVGMGFGLTKILSSTVFSGETGWPMEITWLSVLISFFFSVIVGVLFGTLPAIKASKLNPIEALRFE